MEKVAKLVAAAVEGRSLIAITLSDQRRREREGCLKVSIKPLVLRGAPTYQFTYHYARNDTHTNLPPTEAIERIRTLLAERFLQAVIRTTEADLQVFIDGRGRAAVRSCPPSRSTADLSHNRTKNRLLPEGQPCDFLHRLGVMTETGRVIAARYDKFRQINRYLEMVADVAGYLDEASPVRIVDFGCGKGYLTFALYHYLHHIRGMDTRMVGLDLKADVIAGCETIARDLGYDGLVFEVGGIRCYPLAEGADMVVALHACDTATDEALAKGVELGAKVILSAPCCQHELFRQIENEAMKPMLKHGIVRERLAALITDSLRAGLLETKGYSVQMLEFVETEHTPKNILIRAVRQEDAGNRQRTMEEYRTVRDFWSVRPSLEFLLEGVGESDFRFL